MFLEEDFAQRLSYLRTSKGISARDMSLSLGQNPGYINAIENRKAFPTMSSFFAICDYLEISPKDFFDTDRKDPSRANAVVSELDRLTPDQLELILAIIREITK